MKSSQIAVIIPTFNNRQYLEPCLRSLLAWGGEDFHVYVVNNGHLDSCNWLTEGPVTIVQAGENLGWESGLKLGLAHSTEPIVCFLNDDTYTPQSSQGWLNKLALYLLAPTTEVGAIGPSSNVVMGFQNIFSFPRHAVFQSAFLIGFCLMLRRSVLEAVGGVDDALPGGDDLDLSIRLRNAGYKLMVDRSQFVFHHGFKTGERIHGGSESPGGWNSYEFKDRTDHALIAKHGFRAWWEVMKGAWELPPQL